MKSNLRHERQVSLIQTVLDERAKHIDAGRFGPWEVRVSAEVESPLEQDYSPDPNFSSTMTMKERLLKIEGVLLIVVDSELPGDQVDVNELGRVVAFRGQA